jgi:hypothetical protein
MTEATSVGAVRMARAAQRPPGARGRSWQERSGAAVPDEDSRDGGAAADRSARDGDERQSTQFPAQRSAQVRNLHGVPHGPHLLRRRLQLDGPKYGLWTRINRTQGG